MFFDQASKVMELEYGRIWGRTKEDPGTAGDEGEGNWADLLRAWLPAGYHVVTKGRMIGADGTTTPQLDVVVLRPSYPPYLVGKKLYLADGVAAAFECKNTLRPGHFPKIAKTAAAVRRVSSVRQGDPYRELFGSPVYGVLAHTQDLSPQPGEDGVSERLVKRIESAIDRSMDEAQHPRELIDMVCVADLATWWAFKSPWMGPPRTPADSWEKIRPMFEMPKEGCVQVQLNRHTGAGKPLMSLITVLLRRLAWEDVDLRSVARYFGTVDEPVGGGPTRRWGSEIYSREVLSLLFDQVRVGRQENWDPWAPFLM